MTENNLPRIVTTISFSIAVILLTLIFSYSYLLIHIFTEKKQLTEKLIDTRIQLEEEQEQRFLMEQDKKQLTAQIQEKEEEISQLLVQLKQAEEQPCLKNQEQEEEENIEEQPETGSQTETCHLVYQKVNIDFIHRAAQKTLSSLNTERFEGFSILMNNIDYIPDDLQHEIIELYLNKMDKTNKDGVYYTTFILSQLRPNILKEYEDQIQQLYHSIYQKPGWQRTSYKYCQLENKIRNYSYTFANQEQLD